MPRKTDGNHSAVIRELRRAGCVVADTHELGKGFPDAIAMRAGLSYFLEIKNGLLKPSAQRLTPAEKEWHQLAETAGVKVHIVRNPQEALRAVGLLEAK